MPKIAIAVGAVLIAVGVLAFTASGPDSSPTALIPAVLGLVLVVAGAVSLWRADWRRHAMHAAAAVALIGVLGSAGQLIGQPAEDSEDADIAQVAGVLNLLLCGGFLALAVRSFVQARRTRS